MGSFTDLDSAELAVERLTELGYGRSGVFIISNDETRNRHFGHGQHAESAAAPDPGAAIAKGAAGGGMLGGTIGAIVAAVVGTGAIGLTVATAVAAAPFIAGPTRRFSLRAARMRPRAVSSARSSVRHPGNQAEYADEAVAKGDILVSVKADETQASEVRRVLGQSAFTEASYMTARRT